MLLLPPAAPAPRYLRLAQTIEFRIVEIVGPLPPPCSMKEPIFFFLIPSLSEHQGTHDVTKTGTNGAVGHRGCNKKKK